MIPNITGKQFEALVLFRASKMEDQNILTLGRYGVQVVMMKGLDGKPAWMPIPSLPDVEGVICGTGRQIIMEIKTCSQSSYPMYQTDKKHPKQIDHMLRRAGHGALCFLLIHFNRRVLVRKTEEPETFAIPVIPASHFWRMYQAREVKNLTREDAENYGFRIPWNLYSTRASKLTPDLSYILPENQVLKLQ